MLRIYKDFIRRLLLICLHYKAIGWSVAGAYRDVSERLGRDSISRTPEEDLARRALKFLYEDDGFNSRSVELSELIDWMSKMLISSDKSDDRDLIDTIVRVLELPYSRNALSGSAVSRLRAGLLVPDELSKLRPILEGETSCTRCGHKFQNGEMTVFYSEGPNGRVFVCTRCKRPSSMASDRSRELHISISDHKALSTALNKSYGKEPEVTTATTDSEAVYDAMNELILLPDAAHPGQWIRNPARPPAPPAEAAQAPPWRPVVNRPGGVVVAAAPAHGHIWGAWVNEAGANLVVQNPPQAAAIDNIAFDVETPQPPPIRVRR